MADWSQAQENRSRCKLFVSAARSLPRRLGERVIFREVDTCEHRTVAEWGLADALFLDGKRIMIGPPPSLDRLRKIVSKKVRSL